ncbi:PQQ-dependent sugar dehydrogenase [Cytobacillus sp. FJAT-54145]|uniref:PQQ-dependent sugar dehydrogenase n=1 Tax=Cytobacillus spartinae TaxID=3299023 RepID=A0ABW6KCG6_9BACI
MKKWISLLLILLVGCSSNNGDRNEQIDYQEVTAPQAVEVIAENLQIPWSIIKWNDTFFISERTGSIVRIDSQTVRQKVHLEKPLSTAAEAGLLGFVLSPDFEQSDKAFAYYTYEDSGNQLNRIVTLKLEDNEWTEQEILIDRIPSGQYHHGGRLKIGPDGKLYATTGDATEPEIAQDLSSLGGKILRLNLDGTIPDDNPFPNSYIYSYGHRNPQGLTWSPDGTMYASEHGQSAHDEINLIKAGQNYGWPKIQGDQHFEGMVTPLFHSDSDMTWAPSGMAFHQDKLYVATLRGNAVREFNLKTSESREVVTGLGRIRDVLIIDDSLYFVSNNTDGRGNPDESDDKLYKIELPIK